MIPPVPNPRNCETCKDDSTGNCKFDTELARTSTGNKGTHRTIRRRFTRCCGCTCYNSAIGIKIDDLPKGKDEVQFLLAPEPQENNRLYIHFNGEHGVPGADIFSIELSKREIMKASQQIKMFLEGGSVK